MGDTREVGFQLQGQAVVVTGASQGIGRAIAEHLGQQGAHVVLGDLDGAEQAAAELRAAGASAVGRRCDVRRRADVEALVDAAVQAYGRLDGLVANAGIRNFGTVVDMTEADWDAVIDTNLKGVFLSCQAGARVMKRQGSGAIVTLSSVAAFGGLPQRANYCAAKAGVSNLTRVMALELAPHGVRVNAVGPGSVATAMARANTPEALRAMVARTPLGRLAEPREVSHVVLFLLSQAASYVTGQTIYVDGGWTASLL